MRRVLTCTVLLCAAAALRAQDAPTPPVPVTRSFTIDLAALADSRGRAAVEAITVGRFSIGVGVGYEHQGNPGFYGTPIAYLADAMPCYEALTGPSSCVYPPYPSYYGPTRYRAWSADLAVRYYPAFLSFRNGATKMEVYTGEFVGYHWRTWDESSYYYPPPYGGVYDSLGTRPIYYVPPQQTATRRTLTGWQPGAEIGVRLQPRGPLFIEVGGRFTLVTVDDPWRSIRPGDVESRLVLAIGVRR